MMIADKKDTQIPVEFIPIIVTHWWVEYYYGPGFTILDLRKFLEAKLRTGIYSEDAVKVWVHRAVGWQKLLDQKFPGYVDAILEEYSSLHHAA